jgi:hypothetical protein
MYPDGRKNGGSAVAAEFSDAETQKSLPFASEPTATRCSDGCGGQPSDGVSGANLDELQTIVEVAAYEFGMWLRMSNWAKVNSVLEPRERSLVYSVGRRLREGNLPTFRQAKWAKAILEAAKQHGFDPTASG